MRPSLVNSPVASSKPISSGGRITLDSTSSPSGTGSLRNRHELQHLRPELLDGRGTRAHLLCRVLRCIARFKSAISSLTPCAVSEIFTRAYMASAFAVSGSAEGVGGPELTPTRPPAAPERPLWVRPHLRSGRVAPSRAVSRRPHGASRRRRLPGRPDRAAPVAPARGCLHWPLWQGERKGQRGGGRVGDPLKTLLRDSLRAILSSGTPDAGSEPSSFASRDAA
jgi:hypothetical protein